MTIPHQLVTQRLLLRPFEDRDRAPFGAMNADPEVMRFFASTFDREKSDGFLERYQRQLVRDGFSFLVAEHRETGEFLGVIGGQVMTFAVPGLPQPAVEIGWRLTLAAQGQGYATEGARAVVSFAFNTLHLPSVVAITTPVNTPSRHVMEKLGMMHRPELTFDHPMVPEGHVFREHVLYSLRNPLLFIREEKQTTTSTTADSLRNDDQEQTRAAATAKADSLRE